MTKQQLLRERQAFADELAALRAENLRLRLGEPAEPAERTDETAAPQSGFSRFPLLRAVDAACGGAAGFAATNESQSFPQLPQLAAHLRRYCAAHFGLYADRALYAHVLGAMAAADFVLLRGESPLLLCQAVAEAFGQTAALTAVQPQWSRPADLLGEAEPVTKRYRETVFLRAIYAAGYSEGPCFAALDRITLPPAEGWLAGLLPPKRGRGIPLAEGAWPGDPVLLRGGALPWPDNLWLFGAVGPEDPPPGPNLRAAAMEFCMPEPRAKPFLASLDPPLRIAARELRGLFAHACEVFVMPEQAMRQFRAAAQYLAARLDLSLGPDAETLLRRFGGVCLACGLRPAEALDGFFYHKALRRLEAAAPDTLRYELPGLRRFISETFGGRAMPLTAALLEEIEQKPAAR